MFYGYFSQQKKDINLRECNSSTTTNSSSLSSLLLASLRNRCLLSTCKISSLKSNFGRWRVVHFNVLESLLQRMLDVSSCPDWSSFLVENLVWHPQGDRSGRLVKNSGEREAEVNALRLRDIGWKLSLSQKYLFLKNIFAGGTQFNNKHAKLGKEKSLNVESLIVES